MITPLYLPWPPWAKWKWFYLCLISQGGQEKYSSQSLVAVASGFTKKIFANVNENLGLFILVKLSAVLCHDYKTVLTLTTLGDAAQVEVILFVPYCTRWREQVSRAFCGPKQLTVSPGNTKGGSITVPLTSCLTG
jgi:hypothetical protein